jgi:N-acylneuraminate cytidylyltransferase
MSALAIIPARGGSKRIPGKNIRLFHGKPIMAYSIQLAMESGLFDKVMVSTDSPEIATIGREHGASVPFMRSPMNASDHATTTDVIAEVLEAYAARGETFDEVCCIYPTAPLAQLEHLREGLSLLNDPGVDVVLPVASFSFPIWRGLRANPQGMGEPVWPENMQKRSQDLEPVYHDAGQWYWLKPHALAKPFFENRCKMLPIPETMVQDIDHETDWEIAELKYARLQNP